MLDAFDKLVESGVMTEETKLVVESAFAAKIQENRDQITAQLRAEFAKKYNHDKSVMVEAIDKLVSERLAAELVEFVQDKRALSEATVMYRSKVRDDIKMMESFMLTQLGKELSEFQNDRKRVAENFSNLEKFVVHALAKELTEFVQDKKDLAEAKVKLVKEAKEKFEDIKQQFIKRSARLVKENVTKQLRSEIKDLKEDISNARTHDFGRRIFEAFASEYSASYMNEKSETNKLMKVIQKKETELSEAKMALQQKQSLIESKEQEVRVAKDLVNRKAIMSELLSPLSADKRTVMSELLESVHTSKLASAYDKYLPAVMESEQKKVAKAALTEGAAVVTGNRNVKTQPQVGLDNISDIRYLAGLK